MIRSSIAVAFLLALLCAPTVVHAKPAPPDPAARALNALIDRQIAAWSEGTEGDMASPDVFGKDATFAVTGGAAGDDDPAVPADRLVGTVVSATWITASRITHRAVTRSGDGRSAWLSFDIHMKVDRTEDGVADFPERDYRVSYIAASTADGWRILGGTWSTAQGNAPVNKAALAGKLRALAPVPAHASDAALRDAFLATLTAPLDPATAARADLVTIGSGPGERTVSGAVLAKAWKAAWQGKLTVDGAPATYLAPSGTTGWVVANVQLAKRAGKRAYAIPFRLVFVFDQDAQRAWHLVHAHLAVAP